MEDPSDIDPRVLAARLRHENDRVQRLADIAGMQTEGYEVLPSTFNKAGIALDTTPLGVDRALPKTAPEWKAPDGVDDAWMFDN